MEQQHPLRIYCKNCGAPAGFDILRQTYRCPHCDEVTGLQEAKSDVMQWRRLNQESKKASFSGQSLQECTCPTCGAVVLFADGEMSEACDFCGTKLVRAELTAPDRLPDLIIPFFLTFDEAKSRLLDWGRQHSVSPEGKSVINNIDKLKAYYLPYRLVRGPVYATVTRDNTRRQYHCRGFLEGTAVNTNEQLDNAVLNAMEPFDWSKAVPFEYGYIAGQRVKLSDISEKETAQRVLSEVTDDFLPEVQKAMQTTGVNVNVTAESLSALTVLLPVYFIHDGDFTAAINGQTGRISVTTHRVKRSFPWAIEPAVYTVLATLIASSFYHFAPEPLCLFGAVFACIFFFVMGDSHFSLVQRVIKRSKTASALRSSGELRIEEGKDVLKNAFDNTPVFVEKNKEGTEVPVKIKFYSLWRFVNMFVKMFVLIFLPAIIAAPLHLAQIADTGERFWENFNVGYGAAWYIIAGFIALLYWIRGMRRDIYDHPIIREIKPNGKTKLLGTRASRKCGILYMFGIGEIDKDGKPVTFWSVLKAAPGLVLGLCAVFAVFILGSVAAMLF